MATLHRSKTRKATAQEIAEYADKDYVHTKTLYPLAYWVLIAGVWCAVEGLYEYEGPKYEIMAPDGYHFGEGYDALHSLLCYSLAEVRERSAGVDLKPCTEDCR